MDGGGLCGTLTCPARGRLRRVAVAESRVVGCYQVKGIAQPGEQGLVHP
jgi:hypothetical protein